MIKTRNLMWDNIKGFLILTVLLGLLFHTIENTYSIGKYFSDWFYVFHMPSFIFVSGYFAKSYMKDNKVRPIKVSYLASYYITFQLILSLIIEILKPNQKFSFFNPRLGLWYLLALIVFYLLIPLAQKVPKLVTLTFSIFMGVFVGSEISAGSFFTICRILVFAPFFYAGYYTSEEFVYKLKNLKYHLLIGLVSIIASISLWATMVYFKGIDLTLDISYGHHNYHKMDVSFLEGAFLRLWAYLIAALMIFGLILIAPNFKTVFSRLGKNSLQIYIFHLPLIVCLQKGMLDGIVTIDTEGKTILLLAVGFCLALILSLKPFSYPFIWLRKFVDKIFATIDKESSYEQ